MEWFFQFHPIGVLAFLLGANWIALVNSIWLRGVKPAPVGQKLPSLAVLVPARDEEAGIAACLRSILSQDYPGLEVWLLDDHSQDATARIAADLARTDPRLHVVRGEDVPPGWLGKHWACQQLFARSTGDWVLFLDADTRLLPFALRDAMNHILAHRGDLLSLFPRQEVVTAGERILVPFIFFAAFAFIPLFLARPFRAPGFSFTNGQFMLFRRAAYQAVGGHAAVRSNPTDDMALGKRIIASGKRWLLADGGRQVRCRMYHSFTQSWHGFSKNLFSAFGNRLVLYLFIWLWLAVVFLEPLFQLGLFTLGKHSGYFPINIAWISMALTVSLWFIPYARLRFPVLLALLYPFIFIIAMGVAFYSLILALAGGSQWKGRSLPGSQVRWL